MAKAFGSQQGGKQSINSTERGPKDSGTPKTGFSSAPKGEVHRGGPRPGIQPNSKKIS